MPRGFPARKKHTTQPLGAKIKDYLNLNVFKGDKGIWMIYFLLCMISLVEIYSAASNMTFERGNHWDPVLNQASFLALGFLVILMMNSIPCKFFKLIPVLGLPIAIVMLAYLLIKHEAVNGGARWIDLFGIKFQPSELAKSMLILEVAVVLSKVNQRRKKGDSPAVKDANMQAMRKAFYVVVGLMCLTCGLIAPENFSTAGMLFVVIVAMMYIGNVPFRFLGKGFLVLAVAGALLAAFLIVTPENSLQKYRRALTWKHRIVNKFVATEGADEKNAYNIDEDRQENTSYIAIANSNVIGLGVGNSIERDFLPHAESDFIYSIIVEETGIIGGIVVMMLYVTLLIRVWKTAQKCDRYFPAYLSIGLCLMLVIQALVNMSVAVGLAPVTGQTLPLISHGGTSIVIVSFNIGMILSVSRYAERSAEKADEQELATVPVSAVDDEFTSAEGMD